MIEVIESSVPCLRPIQGNVWQPDSICAHQFARPRVAHHGGRRHEKEGVEETVEARLQSALSPNVPETLAHQVQG